MSLETSQAYIASWKFSIYILLMNPHVHAIPLSIYSSKVYWTSLWATGWMCCNGHQVIILDGRCEHWAFESSYASCKEILFYHNFEAHKYVLVGIVA